MKIRAFFLFLLVSFLGVSASAQPYSFIGLQWGDSYDTINSKLQAAGFSTLLVMPIHDREGDARIKSRIFQDGRLLGRPANGGVGLENNRLIAVVVHIVVENDTQNTYDEVVSSIVNKYGRANIGISKNQSEWGTKDGDSISVSITPGKYRQDRDNISVFYKSARWKLVDKEIKKNESSKF